MPHVPSTTRLSPVSASSFLPHITAGYLQYPFTSLPPPRVGPNSSPQPGNSPVFTRPLISSRRTLLKLPAPVAKYLETDHSLHCWARVAGMIAAVARNFEPTKQSNSACSSYHNFTSGAPWYVRESLYNQAGLQKLWAFPAQAILSWLASRRVMV